MPIDRDKALNAAPNVHEIQWSTRDVLLYHLSVGAGTHAETDPQQHWTYEHGLQVLPTFAMVAGQGISAGEAPPAEMAMPGIDVDLRKLLHAGQQLVVHQPLPTSGTATVSSRVIDVWDKGKAAVILTESTATAPSGQQLWSATTRIWARGEGGFGGHAGPTESGEPPQRQPDHVLESPTSPQQALLYRLNADMNPLHADPEFARAAGFDRPILHGLASYGILAREVVDGVLEGDASRLGSLSVRFAGVMLPGHSIRTEVWRAGDELTLRCTCPEQDGQPVLTHATATVTS